MGLVETSSSRFEARLILAAPLDSGIDAALATCGVWRPILCGELGFQRFRVS